MGERFFGRSPRSSLPNSLTRFVDHSRLIERRKARQMSLAMRKGRSAPNDFREGDQIVVQDLLTKKWNIPGVIKQARISEDDSTRSFVIERSDGSSILRNSKFIKHQWKSPRRHVSWGPAADQASDQADQGSADEAEAL